MSKPKLLFTNYAFNVGDKHYAVKFLGDTPTVHVLDVNDIFRSYEILDKSLKANATHATRILRYAIELDDMPMQNTVRGVKPTLRLIRK